MNKIRIFVKVFTLFLVLSEGKCRKYDIEEESKKLYRENFDSVLKRFRRTPDYLKILNEKMAELNDYYEDIGLQTVYFFNNKLRENIEEMFHEVTEATTTQHWRSAEVIRMRHPYDHFPMSQLNPKTIYNSIKQYRKPQREGEEEEKKNPVTSLDKYHMLTSLLTLQERNMFRDMGFEYAGKIIHSIIKTMNNEDTSQPQHSTKQPSADEHHQTPSTTEHVHEMMSTHFNEIESTMTETFTTRAPEDDTFKFRYHGPKLTQLKNW